MSVREIDTPDTNSFGARKCLESQALSPTGPVSDDLYGTGTGTRCRNWFIAEVIRVAEALEQQPTEAYSRVG
jgi:hypothetical protein